MADKDYWSQLSKKEKADQENESMGVVPKPKPRPKTRSTTVEAKKGGLFTRKGPCK